MTPRPATRTLTGGWRVREAPTGDAARAAARRVEPATGDAWIPAQAPGSVLDDLLRAGRIPDPAHDLDSLACEWVWDRAWRYRRTIEPTTVAPGDRVWLCLDGVDHAGEVLIDGRSVASVEGMFVPLQVEVGAVLADGAAHELEVVVDPAPVSEHQSGRTSRVTVHKPRMSYGWDFCPRLVHQGLWQPVRLEAAGAVRLVDVWARPRLEDDGARGSVEIVLTLDAANEGPARVTATLHGPDGPPVAAATTTVDLAAGPAATATLSLEVDQPARWRPNGLGTSAVHRLRVAVQGSTGTASERTVPVGFRDVRLAPNEGAPAGARGYTLLVDGEPVPISGWNWVPLDWRFGVPQPARLEHQLRLAAESGANLLRVWGGGLLETPAFYDMCDRLGLLVWQEFAQSSSGIDSEPSRDPAFVARMADEAVAVIRARRNHPSLAIWCGGNELQDRQGRPLDDTHPVLAALRDRVAAHDPDRTWLPTSPSGPAFAHRLDTIAAAPDDQHDVHGPWEHQGLAAHHALYDAGTNLLHSEFGVEGMTNRRSHEALVSPDRRWPATRANPVYRHLGDWWVAEPVAQAAFGGRLADLESLRRASQWLQADGLRYAVLAARRRWPRQSGTIPWQLGESFPNAWCTAAVDHHGDPKPAYHAVAAAYRPTVIAPQLDAPVLDARDGWRIGAWAWSTPADAGRPVTARRTLRAIDGSCLDQATAALQLDGRRPIAALPVSLVRPPAELPLGLAVLDLTLTGADGASLASDRWLLGTGSDMAGLLDLPAAAVEVALTVREPDRWTVSLRHTGGTLGFGIRIEDARPITADGWAVPGAGLVHLLPGEAAAIDVTWRGAPRAGRQLVVEGWNVAPAVLAEAPV